MIIYKPIIRSVQVSGIGELRIMGFEQQPYAVDIEVMETESNQSDFVMKGYRRWERKKIKLGDVQYIQITRNRCSHNSKKPMLAGVYGYNVGGKEIIA